MTCLTDILHERVTARMLARITAGIAAAALVALWLFPAFVIDRIAVERPHLHLQGGIESPPPPPRDGLQAASTTHPAPPWEIGSHL